MISVIMSVFNSENTLSRSIESVLNQTHKEFEFLILDDCSTDKSYSIIKKYAEKDKRIRHFRNNNNLGLTKSLNILIEKTKGEFIARQDSDDFSFRNRLELQLSFLINNNLDACTSRAISKQSEKNIPNLSYYLPLRMIIRFKNPFIHGTLLIKKQRLIELNKYNEEYIYAQDFKLFVDMLNKDYRVKIMNKILYELNEEDNLSKKFKEEQKHFFNMARKELK